MGLKNTLDVQIPDEVVERIRTVWGNAVRCIEDYRRRAGGRHRFPA